MFLKTWKRSVALLLAMVMMLTLPGFTAQAAVSEDQSQITIAEDAITTDTTSVKVQIANLPSAGILRIIQLDSGETYEEAKLNNYTSLCFAVLTNLQSGENTLNLTAKPTEGSKIMAVMRDASGEETIDYVSNAVTVTKAADASKPTADEILAACSAKFLRTENFKVEDTSVDVEVKLADSLTDGCYMTLYAYSSNTSFDPDATYNKRLWSGRVTTGTVTCNFNQTLQVGYNVIACLNVPVGEDNYRPVNSQPIQVVDENGESFKDYTYPDVKIDESSLEEGTTTVHLTLTGDERLFQAAQEDKISITCAVAQYPEGESFDFEGENQISLVSNLKCAEAFSGKEVTLSEPVKAGYRVRAVVYWTQNEELFLPKGNDYEESFHRPDDSVGVVAKTVEETPTIAVDGVVTEDQDFTVKVAGTVPEGSMILVKSYPADTLEFAMTGGTWVASKFDVSAGTYTITPNTGVLSAGDKVVAFLQKGGDISAQSVPVSVQQSVPFVITTSDVLTTESTAVRFQIQAVSVAEDANINIVSLCKMKEDGTPDTANPIARKFGQTPGEISFDLTAGSLSAGDKICLVLTYDNGNKTFTSQAIPVVEEDSVNVEETSFTVESKTATVIVKGCEDFKGGYLFLATGKAGDDRDSRTKLATVSFTGEGTYPVTFNQTKLNVGETVLAYLYKYDADTDRIYTKEAAEVPIIGDAVKKDASVEIVTSNVRADRSDVWVQAEYDESLTGKLALYCHEGDAYTEVDRIYYEAVSSKDSSQKISFGAGKLEAGKNLTAELELSDGTEVVSNSVVISAIPEKVKPQAKILTEKVTAGITHIQASMMIDSDTKDASYVLYQFTGDAFDTDTATALTSGKIYKSTSNQTLYFGANKLKEGAKLLLVLTADGVEGRSDEVTIQPSPDWGTPYAAFDVSAVSADATEIPVTIQYAEEYLSLGDEFYCDVTIYQFSAAYTDQEFEEKELWENPNNVIRIGQVNSRLGMETNGKITVPVSTGVTMNPGDRLIIKLRLPHTEWEGEEVDYVSASVPILAAGEEAPAYKVVLYNLSEDSSRGNRVRTILEHLGIPTETLKNSELNETVGYLAGLDGYEKADQTWDGDSFDTEFMLLCNLPESLLDRFLDEMQANGLRIDHKAVVTEYNRDAEFHELIEEIQNEHEVFQWLIALNSLVNEANALDAADYQGQKDWDAFQQAIKEADGLLRREEPTAEELETSYETLKTLYLSVTGKEEITGTAVISVTKNENGTYRLEASVKDVRRAGNGTYTYKWRTGETTAIIDQVSADLLQGETVEIGGENYYGTLKAQLSVPDAPLVTVTSGKGSLLVQWEKPEETENQMLPESYVVRVYEGNTLVKELEVDGNTFRAEMNDLEEGKEYTVKVEAISPVGRSDRAVLTAKAEENKEDPTPTPEPTPIPEPNPVPTPDPTPGTAAKPGAEDQKQELKASAEKQKGKKKTSNPKTGDESPATLYLVMLALSGAVALGAGKKRRRG